MAVEVGEAYVSIVPSARGFGQALASQTEGPAVSAGETAGASFGASFVGSLGKLAAVGAAVGVAVGAAVVGAGVGLFKLGDTFDAAFDKIRVTTGATGQTLLGLQDSFKQVFSDVPTDADSAASAVSTLNQKLGLSGKPLETLSEQLLNLSRITGTDLQQNIGATVDVFNSFGIAAEDQPKKLDELFRASQKTGVGVGDLAATMANAGPNLTQLGLNFEQSAALVAIFGKAGVDVTAVLPALSKTIVKASKDGKDAGDVFKETFDRIKNAPSDTEAAGAAIDTFGARAGPKLAGLIRQGKLGYEELAQAIADGGDTINGAAADTADFAEKWGTFKNQVLVGLEPLATGVFNAVGNAMEAIGPKVGPVIAKITDGLMGFAHFAVTATSAFADGFRGLDSALQATGIMGFIGDVGQAVNGLSQTAKAVFEMALPVVIDIAKTAFQELKDKVKELVDFVDTHKGAFDAITAGLLAFAGAITALKAASSTLSLVSSGLQGILAIAPLLFTPVGLVALAIGALAAAAFLAYQKIPAFHDAVNAVKDAFKDGGFGAAVQEAGNQFGKLWDVVQPKLTELLGNIGSWITGTALPAIQAQLAEWGKSFGNWVEDTAWPAIRDKLPVLLGNLGAWIRDTGLPWIEGKLIEWGKAFGDWVQTTAIPWLEQNLPLLLGAISDWVTGTAIPQLVTFGRNMGIALLKFAGETALRLPGEFAKIDIALAQWAAEFISKIPGIVLNIGIGITKWIAQGIAQGFGDIVSTLAQLSGIVLGALSGAGGWLVDTGASILNGLWNGIQSAVGAVASFFAGLGGQIMGWIGDFATLLYTHGNDIINGFINGINAAVGGVVSFFQSLPGWIVGWLGSLGELLVGAGSDAINGMVNGLNAAVGGVSSFFSNLPGWIVSWLGSLGGLLVGQGSDAVQGVTNGANAAVGDVSSFFSNLPGWIVSWLGSLDSLLTGAGGDVISGFINGIVSWISSIAGHISSIPGTVRSAIGDTGSLLYDAGAAVVSGFVDGITGAIGDAASAAANLARSVKDAAFSALKVGSPSKVFMELGVNVGEGFVLGLESMAGDVNSAVQAQYGNLTSLTGTSLGMTANVGLNGTTGLGAVAPLRAGSATLMDSQGGSGSQYSINQTFNNANVDANQVARELSWTLLTRGR